MRLLTMPEVLAVAAHVLGCDGAAVAARTDLGALELALGEQRSAAEAGDTATAAAGLLRGLVRRRPFRGPNRTIAVAATLQLLALNGCDLELEPVDEIDNLLDKVAADALGLTALADQLSLRIRPLPRTGRPPEGEGMFERFSDRAREAVTLAQDEARLLGHGYIGTEHVLLGLIREGEGVAARVLADLGVSLPAVRALVEEVVGRGDGAPDGHIPFTGRAKKVLELSLREALQLGHNYIGTEHILLGLIREGEGVAAEVLVKLGADLGRTRGKVVAALRGPEGRDLLEPPAFPPGLPWDLRGRRKDKLREALAENADLRAEILRLRRLLNDHGIDPAA